MIKVICMLISALIGMWLSSVLAPLFGMPWHLSFKDWIITFIIGCGYSYYGVVPLVLRSIEKLRRATKHK